MAKGIKIALPTYNATTDTNPNHFSLYVDQSIDYILIKEKISQVNSIIGTINIAHGLSYVPFCLVFVETSSGVWRKVFSVPISGSGYWFEVNATNLVLKNTTGVAKNFAYRIFYDNIDGASNNSIDLTGAVLAVTRIGKDVRSTDPNDFIFHSKLNTFKIIKEATITITLAASTSNQSFTDAHGQTFIPVATAFAKESGVSQVFLPNSDDVNVWGSKLGWTSTGVRFNYVAADATNVIFNFDNSNASTKSVSIRYFVLERVN